jgi:endonuclease YncB( thermonuclease family)
MELVNFVLILATIVGVIDKDTIRVTNDEGQTAVVSLACINIPETVPKADRVAATERVKELLPSGTPIVIRTRGMTNNNRPVGEIFVDNRSVNLRLVEEGKAIVEAVYLDDCDENKTQLLIAEANAKNKRLGLWKYLNPRNPKN